MLPVLAGGEVNLLLTFRHGFHIFLEANELALLVAVVQQQVLAALLVGAVFGHGAVFQLKAEGIVEFLVLLPVVFQHGLQLGLDLLLDVPGDDGELAVVLEHFTADVQAQVLAVHNAPDEAEVLRQQILAVFHDHHAGGIQLQSTLEVLGVEIVGRLAGDIEQGLEGDAALGAGVDDPQGLVVVEELLPVEGLVLLVGDILLGALPDGNHGVQSLHFGVGLILGLVLGGVFLLPGLLHFHDDGVADVVRVFLHQTTDFVFIQILAVLLVVGVGLQGHDHVSAGQLPLAGFNGVAVGAVGNPFEGFVLAGLFGDNGDGGGHHEGGVEAYAELADDVHIIALFHGLLEAERAGLADGAQILFHFLPGHADAVVGNGENAGVLGPGDGDFQVVLVHIQAAVRQGQVGQLIDGVGGVGDDLPEENLPVGIDGVDHQIQQTLGLGLKLHFFHNQLASFQMCL